jgi:hypothetical protein
MAYAELNLARGLSRIMANLMASIRRSRNKRYINDLPDHILKDIGWPDAYAERSGPPNATADGKVGTCAKDRASTGERMITLAALGMPHLSVP